MKPNSRLRVVLVAWLVLALVLAWPAHPECLPKPDAFPPDVAQSIRRHMNYLAGDALGGRGSGTPQEHSAAEYVASELRRYGVAPAGDNGGYLQRVELEYRSLAAPPVLSFDAGGQTVRWTHGKEIAVAWLSDAPISGPLEKLDPTDTKARFKTDAVVLLMSTNDATAWQQSYEIAQRGAALVLVPDSPSLADTWAEARHRLPKLPPRIKRLPGAAGIAEMSMVVLRMAAFKTLAAMPDGTMIQLEAKLNPGRAGKTWNTLGMIAGRDPTLRNEAVMFSAHLDHLGTKISSRGKVIYHGADDDASGVSAVLELAHAFAPRPSPPHTVLVAFFGSEGRG